VTSVGEIEEKANTIQPPLLVFFSPSKHVLKAMNMKDPEEMKLVEKLEEELFEHKMMFEDLRRQLIEVNNE